MTLYALYVSKNFSYPQKRVIGVYDSERRAIEEREILLTIISTARNSPFREVQKEYHNSFINWGGTKPLIKTKELQEWEERGWNLWDIKQFTIEPFELNKTGNLYE